MLLTDDVRINQIAAELEKNGGVIPLDEEAELIEHAILYVFEGKANTSSPLRAFRVGKISPTAEQDTFARILLEHLNAYYHHDGYWKLCWTSPAKQHYDTFSKLVRVNMPQQLLCAFFDKDDDRQFVMDIVNSIDEMLECGFTHWHEQCEQSHTEWQNMRKVIGIVEGVNTYKAAQGEAATKIN